MFNVVWFKNPQVFVSFFFFTAFWFFSSFCGYFPFIWCLLLFINCRAHLSMPISIPIFWLHILSIRVCNSFSFLANSLMSSMYIRGLIFFWRFVEFSLWLSSRIVITNSNCNSVSPWKIPVQIFTSDKIFPSADSSTIQFLMVFSINFMTSPDIQYSWDIYYQKTSKIAFFGFTCYQNFAAKNNWTNRLQQPADNNIYN